MVKIPVDAKSPSSSSTFINVTIADGPLFCASSRIVATKSAITGGSLMFRTLMITLRPIPPGPALLSFGVASSYATISTITTADVKPSHLLLLQAKLYCKLCVNINAPSLVTSNRFIKEVLFSTNSQLLTSLPPLPEFDAAVHVATSAFAASQSALVPPFKTVHLSSLNKS